MEYSDIKETIVNNLKKNGYPEKKVSFNKDSLESFVKKHDYELDDILGEMEAEAIYSKLKNNKIIFSSTEFAEAAPEGNPFSGFNNDDMKKKAFEMMQNMSPEELESIKKKIDAMSDEEKAEMMNKAREMGLM